MSHFIFRSSSGLLFSITLIISKIFFFFRILENESLNGPFPLSKTPRRQFR